MSGRITTVDQSFFDQYFGASIRNYHMQRKNVKTNLLDHSQAKIKLLGEYLKSYLGILSNLSYNERIRIYDLFCGEGEYDNGGEGSPLVILRNIKELHSSGVIGGKIPPIDCQFNDLNASKIEKLKKVIAEKKLHDQTYGHLEFTSNNYMDEVKKLIDIFPKLKNEKAFVFIDPYDYKHIKASHIRDLLASKKAEVLLWQPTQFMYRFEKNGTPQSLKDFIDELIPFENWTESETAWEFIEKLKKAFRDYLGKDYFVDTFRIQKDPRTVFCLFFFSSHIRGFEKMLDAKWRIDQEQGKGWEYSGQANLFRELKTNDLEEKLKEFMQSKPTNGELYEFTLHAGFRTTHAVEILTNWQDQKILDVVSPKGDKIRKHAFYISYEYYSKEPTKVQYIKK